MSELYISARSVPQAPQAEPPFAHSHAHFPPSSAVLVAFTVLISSSSTLSLLPWVPYALIPVRFGVFIMSTLFLIGGSIIAAAGWFGATHKEQAYLTRNQEGSIIIASLSYTVLAVVSLFGLIGTIIKNRTFVSLYSTVVSCHLGVSLGTAAYFIYTLFHKVGEHDVNSCIAGNIMDETWQKDCVNAFDFVRGMIIGIYMVFWLFELWGCLIVAGYVAQLEEEELDYPPPADMAASMPPLATTYNWVIVQGDSYGQHMSEWPVIG